MRETIPVSAANGCRRPRLATAVVIMFIVLARMVGPSTGAAQTRLPAQPLSRFAEQMRADLVQAQIAITRDPAAARQHVLEAQRNFGLLSLPESEVTHPYLQSATQGLQQAMTAVAANNAAGIAEARAATWTAVLGAGYVLLEESIRANDAVSAQRWLELREFRTATRFSRPGADATLAVAALGAGERVAAEVILSVRADLLDTYQARLSDALRDSAAAEGKQFAARLAETTALAQGYFDILLPAFREQRGDNAARAARQILAGLHRDALSGAPLAATLAKIAEVLRGFRAAPLSLDEQARRAGQMFRFLSLVPVEYERGVRSGEVVKDIEVVEAITFRNAAAAAFADLRSILDLQDKAAAAQADDQFAQLGRALADSSERKRVADPADVRRVVDQLAQALTGIAPVEWLKHNSAADFDVIHGTLDALENAVRAGQYDLAESARIDAYALLESGPEARLSAFAPQYVLPIENLFWQGQEDRKGLALLIQERATVGEIKATRAELEGQLKEAQAALGATSSPEAAAANAGIIVLREGMEAVLILASLMGSMKAASQRKLRRPMWIGAAAAALATAVTWLVARGALTLLARYGEMLEASVSIVAVAMLLVVMNWFFHDVYWTGWMSNFHARKRRILSGETGQMLGLVILGFTSVYREGFETVLFLQALVLESGADIVLVGTAVGLALTLLLGWVTFTLQARLPYKKMLIVTGVLIGVVLVTMVGKTAHAFQVVGWLPISPLRGLLLPHWLSTWFGVFATWQGVVVQISAAVFVIGSYFLAERWRKGRTGKATFAPAEQVPATRV